MFWTIFWVIHIPWAIFVYYLNEKLFKRYSFFAKKEVMESKEYPAFGRSDYPRWSRLHFFLCGTFLGIPRTILGVGSLFWVMVILKVFGKIYGFKDDTKPLHPTLKKICTFVVSVGSRVILFASGVWWIKKKKVRISEDKHAYFDKSEDSLDAIVIANHVNYFDIFGVLVNPGGTCFIANAVAKHYPLAGEISRMMQCIFLDRNHSDSRKKCFDDMKKRCENIKKYPNRKQTLILVNSTRVQPTGHFRRGHHDGGQGSDPLQKRGLQRGGVRQNAQLFVQVQVL